MPAQSLRVAEKDLGFIGLELRRLDKAPPAERNLVLGQGDAVPPPLNGIWPSCRDDRTAPPTPAGRFRLDREQERNLSRFDVVESVDENDQALRLCILVEAPGDRGPRPFRLSLADLGGNAVDQMLQDLVVIHI